MPIIKGISADRAHRVVVKGNSLEELKDALKLKLHITAESTKIFLEEDGTEIDDFEILSEMCEDAKKCQTHVTVMLLPGDTVWTPPNVILDCLTPSSTTSSNPQQSPVNPVTPITPVENGSSLTTPHLTPVARRLPFQQLNQLPALSMNPIADQLNPIVDMLDKVVRPKNFLKLRKAAVKHCYTHVGEFMKKKLSDYSKATARHYAEEIIKYKSGKFAPVFEIQVGDNVANSGLQSFTQQIYGYVCYSKGDDNKVTRGSRKRKTPSQDQNEENECEIAPNRKQDRYGCVAYEIPLPLGETEETQEEKRVQMLNLPEISEQTKNLMEITYASQRIVINRARPLKSKLPLVIEKWPHLVEREHFLRHAAVLLGKNVSSVWYKSLGDHSGNVVDFMSNYWKSQALMEKPPAITNEMLGVLNKKEQVVEDIRSQTANSIAIFPLIIGYMKEAQSEVFILLDNLVSDVEAFESISKKTENPLLLVRGDSIFDEFCTSDVVILGKLKISCSSVLEGFLILILSHFVFPFAYPNKTHSTLEFMQRYFLSINPPAEEGDKREIPKRCVDTIDSKVKDLSRRLMSFTSPWVAYRESDNVLSSND